MPNSGPPIPTRINITLYGALLLSMLLGLTAVAAREGAAIATLTPTAEPFGLSLTTKPFGLSLTTKPFGLSLTTKPTPTETPTPAIRMTATPTAAPTLTPSTGGVTPPLPTGTGGVSPPLVPPLPTGTGGVSLPLVPPLPTPDGLASGRVVRAPILMYHHVGPIPPGADQIRVNLTVTPENFAAQMKFLAESGYSTISLYDLQYALALGWPLPEKPVILTFDDGYDDIYEHALPHMQARGFTGVVFVITQFVDENRPGYLTWAQVENLRRAGWNIEPHSKTHDDLKGRGRDFLIYQILGSRQTIEAHIGRQPRFFNYPSGAYDEDVIGVLKEAGFWGAVTTEAGVLHRLSGMYTLRRVRVSFETTLDDLRLYLERWDF